MRKKKTYVSTAALSPKQSKHSRAVNHKLKQAIPIDIYSGVPMAMKKRARTMDAIPPPSSDSSSRFFSPLVHVTDSRLLAIALVIDSWLRAGEISCVGLPSAGPGGEHCRAPRRRGCG